MPRAGDGTYSLPPGTAAVANTTATSADVNSRFNDLESDANAARPIVAGGTGATTAANARTALGAQASNANLASLAGLTLAADRGLYSTAASTLALFTLTSAGRALLDDADASAQRTTLGLGTFATVNTVDRTQDLATWKAGADTTESLISPDKLNKTINGRMYESAAFSIANSTQYVLTHGLGVIPDFVTLELVCTTNDAGYTSGQSLEVAATSDSDAGVSVRKTSASVVVRIGSAGPGKYTEGSAYTTGFLTASSWTLIVRAFRFS